MVTCPECGSANVSQMDCGGYGWLQCNACGYKWDNEDEVVQERQRKHKTALERKEQER